MAKHSHWHNIRHQKAKEDKKKAKLYAKHSDLISTAAKESGGDPDKNVALKQAIENAKEDDVPKENIERAIKKGTGELLDEGEMEQIIYEGYGPDGIAFLIEAVTDNRNRTASDLKYVFSQYGGSLGSSGSVKWQFDYISLVEFEKNEIVDKNWDQIQLDLMESGAEDILKSEDIVKVKGPKSAFNNILSAVQEHEIETKESGLMWVAQDKKDVNEEIEEEIGSMKQDLLDLDDVERVFTNHQ